MVFNGFCKFPNQEAFCDYLRGLDCSDIEVYAISEGSVVFPKVPLLRIEGPVAVSLFISSSLSFASSNWNGDQFFFFY